MPEDLSQKGMESDVSSIRFEPAKGGLISHTEKLEKGNKYGPMHKSETAVHTNLSSAVGHMRKAMESHFGKGMKKKSDKGLKK